MRYKYIRLTKGKRTIVDAEDYDRLSRFKWYLNDNRRAARMARLKNKKMKMIYMAREIMKCPKHMYVDHISMNQLDNRKSNLRICTHSQNDTNRKIRSNNKTGFKGIHWDKERNKFVAQIKYHRNKRKFIGRFDCPKVAAKAWDNYARKFHGKFARYNFPLPGELSNRP